MTRLLLGLLLWLMPAAAFAAPQVGTHLNSAGQPEQNEGVEVFTSAATSTPLVAAITSSAATLTSGASQLGGATASCSFAAGVGKCGPLVPQLGRAIRVVTQQATAFQGTWYVGTSTNNCTTVNRLTSADTLQTDFTGQVNDYLDVPPSTGSVGYCLVATITSGTLDAAVRQ